MFLKFDVSCVFAASPIERILGPKPISDLQKDSELEVLADVGQHHVRCLSIRDLIGDNIDTAVSGDTNLILL